MSKYNKGKHTVYHNDKGEEVPSVTTILKVLNKPNLIGWANYMGLRGKKVKTILDDTSSFGTMVHSLIDGIINNKYIIYIHDINASYSKLEIMLAMRNFIEWKDANEIVPIMTETKLEIDDYGGTLDFYGTINGKLTLLDFKTSKAIRLSMFIQLALYTILLESNGYEVEQVGILIVNKNKSESKFLTREELDLYIGLGKDLVRVFHKHWEIDKRDNWNESLISDGTYTSKPKEKLVWG